MTLEPGTRFGSYEIVSRLGAGGMGVVYKAIDRRLNRPVAIKAVTAAAAVEDRAAWTEALAVASLDHPYICKLYEVLDTADGLLIVMEFVEGETLATVLKRGPLSPGSTARIGAEIAEGLADAHARGLVHRDVKPANVMVTAHGHIKLLDFGLARQDAALGAAETTRAAVPSARSRAGTPSYMAPEQALGEALTARADLFSLGVVLFECLTHALPFEGATTLAYLNAVVASPPKSLATLAPNAPRELSAIIDRCLAKVPASRPASTSALAAELRAVAEAAGSAGTGTTRAVRPRHAWRVPMIVALGAAVAVTAVVVWLERPGPAETVRRLSEPLITMWPSDEGGSRVSPDGRWVSWLSNPKGREEVFVRALEGGDAHALALPEGDVVTHTWSPDGRSIACVVVTTDRLLVQVVPAVLGGAVSESVPLPLAPTRHVRALRWVGAVVFLEVQQVGHVLYRVDLDRGTVENLSAAWHVSGTLTAVDVNADGRRAVLLLDNDDQENLWVADVTGTAARQVTHDRFFKRGPVWSGAGDTVIYESNRGGQRELWALDVVSGRVTTLASGGTENVPESSSADGRVVTFQRVTETANLFVVAAGGGPSRQFTADALNDASPMRSLNGQMVAFQRNRPLAEDTTARLDAALMVARMSRSGPDIDAHQVAVGFYARLSPDGRRLAYLERQTSAPGVAVLHVEDLSSLVATIVSNRCVPPDFTITPSEWASQNVAWTTDGAEVYYAERPLGGRAVTLRAYDVNTSASRLVAAAVEGEQITDIYPSADRERVAYLTVASLSREGRVAQLNVAGRGAVSTHAVTRLDGPNISLLGWTASGQGMLAARSSGPEASDGSRAVEIIEVSAGGAVRTIVKIAHGFRSTARFEPAAGLVYFTGSDLAVRNLYCLTVRDGSIHPVTDNREPTVTFSGAAPLPDGSVMYVRGERREEIWLLRTLTESQDAGSGKRP